MDHDAGTDRPGPGSWSPVAEGHVLAGRYEIRRRLGTGRMGAVYAAFDRDRGAEMAIKVFRPEFLENERAAERFLDETKLAGSLNHPGIVNVFEGGREGPLHYVAMELLEVPTLRQRMDALRTAGQRFAVEEVVYVGVTLARALASAHQQLVHGAVRPENIFLLDDGTVKLTDFGTAGLLHVGGLATTGISVGAVPYLAPEQLRGSKDPDHRVDQYATAAVMYEMLTGEAPAGRWKPAMDKRPETPRRLSRTLDRALESAPADRFVDMVAFADALAGRPTGQGHRRRAWTIAGGVLLLIAAGATFPKWGGPVSSIIRSALHDDEARTAANTARTEALASASTWRKIAALLPDEGAAEEVTSADQALAEGGGHFEGTAYGEAETSFRRAAELYESQLAAAMEVLRNEPARVAEAARNLNGQLDALHGELFDRVAEAARHLEGCEQNLRGTRTEEERKAIEVRRRAATAESGLLSRLNSLTEANVFNPALRAEITTSLDQADQQLEAARYAEALTLYAETKSRLEELLAWPDQAEQALRQQLGLAQELEQVRAALGPVARELVEVKAVVNEAAEQISRGDDELAAGRVPEAITAYQSAREHLAEVETQAVAGLLALSQAYDRERKNSAAVLALDELLTWDPDHATGQALRQKILACRVNNSIGMELVFIPPGAFRMGSPAYETGRDEDERQQRVRLDTGFFMGATEVTQTQWRAVMGSDPSERKGDDLPVEQVTWEKAAEFCRRLSEKEGRPYRLPTEAEWEYACRAGTTTAFSFGEALSTDQANFDGERPYGNGDKGVFRNETTPGGSFPANAWGLHDMHGNVWEWCLDAVSVEDLPPVNESTELVPEKCHILRGGSWRNRPMYCRSANRVLDLESSRLGNIGFRVVLESE